MLERDERDGKFLGYRLKKDDMFFFFGSRHLTRANIPQYFPQWQFSFLKQVHGKAVVEADPLQVLEADAHFTDRPGVALVIQTADCVPILLASSQRVAAIHAGWRSIALAIIEGAAWPFDQDPVRLAAIGPHIRRESFEVGMDVAKQLGSGELTHPHANPQKVYFDLTRLVHQQLRRSFGDKIQTWECSEDTKTSPEFHSFRRDREQAERQYSFVVINR